MKRRGLGVCDPEVSPLGLVGIPLGGAMLSGEGEEKYRFFRGDVDDKETIHTIHKAMDLGINFFDTATAVGAGQSEQVLRKAFAGQRDLRLRINLHIVANVFARLAFLFAAIAME